MTIQRKKEGNLFKGCVFALVLDTSDYDAKKTLRKKITCNGGTVSYLVTNKCHFVVCCPSVEGSSAWGLRTARKYAVPTVPPQFIDACLAENKILNVASVHADQNQEKVRRLEQQFCKGHIGEAERNGSKTRIFQLTKALKVWDYGDVEGPHFHEHPHRVAKIAVLKGERRLKGDVPFCVLEIHVSEAADPAVSGTLPKYCVFVDVGAFLIRENQQVEYCLGTKASARTCRYTDDRDAALRAYCHLYKMYTSPPHSYRKWQYHCIIPSFIGSPEFQKVQELFTLSADVPDERVQELVDLIWKEAEEHLKESLARDVANIHCTEIDQAESLLLEIRELLHGENSSEKDKEKQELSERYTDITRPKEKLDLSSPDVLVKQRRLLQIVRDVAAIREALCGDSSERSATLIKYAALGCRIRHLQEGSEEYSEIKEKIMSSSKDTMTIKNIFAVLRPVEESSFAQSLSHQKALFHGSKACNFVGILSRGLLLEEEEDRMCDGGEGHVTDLGQAIYFSDSAGTSTRYSTAGRTKGTRLMSVVRVALGRCYPTQKRMPGLASPPEGYDSVWGVGSTDPEASDFQENEFAIFHLCQQKQTHLVEFTLPGDQILSTASELLHVNQAAVNAETLPVVVPTLRASDVLDEFITTNLGHPLHCGLLSTAAKIPLKSVHVRATLIDLAAKVVILQEYFNESVQTVEAKYIFPLEEMAAVCAFEAFINGKHVVGEIEERGRAHKRYRKAIQEGHGAYLMDEEGPDVFSVNVGNLPAHAVVVIKITYVAELLAEDEKIKFRLPGTFVSEHETASHKEQIIPTETEVDASSVKDVSIHIGIEMPFDIRKITSPTHRILIKKTDTMATVQLSPGQNLGSGFELLVDLAEIHVPRMWVERLENEDSEACMLTFYPSFGDETTESGTVILLLDASNSMEGKSFQMAQKITLLALRHLHPEWKFNVILFGSVCEELFLMPQPKSPETISDAEDFILGAKANLGCTEPLVALESLFLLGPKEDEEAQNILLISDGQFAKVGHLLFRAAHHVPSTRIFTFGVGKDRCPCHRHILRVLARRAAGAFEYFDPKQKSKWEAQVHRQLCRASRPVLTDIQIQWQQLDHNAVPPIQAPRQLPSLFHGERQVIYGFVPRCTMATLTARAGGHELSTVVSTSELSKTEGMMLHRLTARAIIEDWNDGILEDDGVHQETKKLQLTSYIVSLSKQYGILCSLTSYVAIEKRDKERSRLTEGLKITELLDAEDVDRLPYVEFPEARVERLESKTVDQSKAKSEWQSALLMSTHYQNQIGRGSNDDWRTPMITHSLDEVQVQNRSLQLECQEETRLERIQKKKKKMSKTTELVEKDVVEEQSVLGSTSEFLLRTQLREVNPEFRVRLFGGAGFQKLSPEILDRGTDAGLSREIGLNFEEETGGNGGEGLEYTEDDYNKCMMLTRRIRRRGVSPSVPLEYLDKGTSSESEKLSCSSSDEDMGCGLFDIAYDKPSEEKSDPNQTGNEQQKDLTEVLAEIPAALAACRAVGFKPPSATAVGNSHTGPLFGIALRYPSSAYHPTSPSVTTGFGSASTGQSFGSAGVAARSAIRKLVSLGGGRKRQSTVDAVRCPSPAVSCEPTTATGFGSFGSSEITTTSARKQRFRRNLRFVEDDSPVELDICPEIRECLKQPQPETTAKATTTQRGLPTCLALMDKLIALDGGPSFAEIRALLKQGPGPRQSSLNAFQEKVTAFFQPRSVSGVQNLAIAHFLQYQAQDGSFPMASVGQWHEARMVESVVQLLDERGLKSIGLSREYVLNMCFTLMAIFKLWKMLSGAYPDVAAHALDRDLMVVTDCCRNQPQVLAVLLKALTYVLWVHERQPLLYETLSLSGSIPTAGATWECFVMSLVKDTTTWLGV